MDLNACYAVSRDAAIRPERFGGLVYRYDNRRLYFLYSRDLVDFVCALDSTRPLGVALDTFLADRGLPGDTRDAFLAALARLERMQVLVVSEENYDAEVCYRA